MKKINYIEISDKYFEDYKLEIKVDVNNFSGYLFNGSRRGIIEEDSEVLSKFLKECDVFLTYLKNNIHDIFNEYGIGFNERYKKVKLLYRVDTYDEISNFQYGDFYVTTNFLTAISFSNNGAGELGELAYKCICDIRNLGVSFKDDKINDIVNHIVECYEKYEKTERIILSVGCVSFDDLQGESGFNYDNIRFRENLYKSIQSEFADKEIRSHNFRMLNFSKYQFMLIPESMFLSLIPKFTFYKEEDVHKLKNDYIYSFSFLFDK